MASLNHRSVTACHTKTRLNRNVSLRPTVVVLEDRTLLNTYSVFNASDCAIVGCGSLRQAIEDANGNAGLDTIAFNIGGTGPHTIHPTFTLPPITSPVIIDGTTQTGYAGRPLIELAGDLAGTNVSGLTVVAGDSTVRGLVINRFAGHGIVLRHGGGNFVYDCYVGANVTGGAPAANLLHGIFITSSNNTIGGGQSVTVISGNAADGVNIATGAANVIKQAYIGIDATGMIEMSNQKSGVYVGRTAFGSIIGGTTPGSRNIIASNKGDGIKIEGISSIVQGNIIGNHRQGNGYPGNDNGVHLSGYARDNTIGGTIPGATNIISGNKNDGILIRGTSANNNVEGNLIGTDVLGTARVANKCGIRLVNAGLSRIGVGAGNIIAGNSESGICLSGTRTQDNTIKGNNIGISSAGGPLGNTLNGVHVGPGADQNTITENLIAYNGAIGVIVDTSTGNAVRGNSIHDNAALGISLINNGNNNQPAPVVTSVTSSGGTITIHGTLTAAANTTYDLDFFSSPSCDPSGFGEGDNYLGTSMATTNGGVATFTAMFPVSVPSGHVITATATSPAGDTSGFSACSAVPMPPLAGHLLNVVWVVTAAPVSAVVADTRLLSQEMSSCRLAFIIRTSAPVGDSLFKLIKPAVERLLPTNASYNDYLGDLIVAPSGLR